MEDAYLEMDARYFERGEIVLIEAMPDGDRYLLTHIKLMLLGCESDGKITGSPSEICEAIGERDVEFFVRAVGLFEEFGLVEFENAKSFRITDFQNGKCRKREYPKGRNTYEYRLWRNAVCERDKYTCQICGCVGGRIEAHHIKPWAKFIDYRYDIGNGVALCNDCHKIVHGRKKRGNILYG